MSLHRFNDFLDKHYTNETKEVFVDFLHNYFLKDKFTPVYDKDAVLSDYIGGFSFIQQVNILGSADDLEDLIVLEIIKKKGSSDSRVGLTKEIFKLISNKDFLNKPRFNVLAIVRSDLPSKHWRLSLITSEGKTRSNPRRFSFLLGDHEKTKTARDYLFKKIEKFDDLKGCFNVEVVRQEFFDRYLELYVRFYKEISNLDDFKQLLVSQGTNLVSFTKNLLGKIIFLYFIQKKGWLGVERGGEYGKDGKLNFMRYIWDDFEKNNESLTLEKTGSFYNDYLERLFYDGLNKDRRDDDDYFPNLQMKVPYLNGGLFKEDYKDWERNKAQINNGIFSNANNDGILDVFDTYNFTIDEDDLYDREVAVDPEMLGKIFEKMIAIDSENIDKILDIYLGKVKGNKSGFVKMDIENWNVGSNNKKLGAFYTPREIVHYMTKESLIAYLINIFGAKKESLIRNLFDIKEKFLISKEDLKISNLGINESVFEEISEIVIDIDEALKKIKILDPAIGSGAFPMGLLYEISSIRYYMYGVFNKRFGDKINVYKNANNKLSIHKIKRVIIQDNIYGVDIDPGAIDIARLRFWLSLVVDEEKPEPLPNFEFKFVCANTLLPLEDEDKQPDIFGGMDNEAKLDTLKKYRTQFYNANTNKEKDELKDRIRNYTKIGPLQLGYTPTKRALQIQEFGHNFDNSKHSHSFFDPSLMLSEWRGFDIVIGNPPYIKEYDNKSAFDGLRDRQDRKYYMGKMDIWYYFACLGLDLLKDGGIESFIAQNNWITSHGAKIMRNKLLQEAKIKEFIDFGDYKVFENVGIQTMIYILEKTKNNDLYATKYSRLNNKNFDRKDINRFLLDIENTAEYIKHYSKIEKNKYIDKTLDFVDDEKDDIISQILNEGKNRLTEKEVAQGIVYPQDYLNDKNNIILGGSYKIGDGIFVLNDTEKESLNLTEQEKKIIKPSFNTEQVGRYFADNKNKEWVIYTDSTFKDISKIEEYPNIKKHLDKFKEVITSDNKPYGLHRSRDERFFVGGKIVATRKCIKPSFSYVDFDSYVSATFYVIKTDRIDMKFLTGLLNSSLIEFRLRNKGKMQGNNYQLDKDPLINIPIKTFTDEDKEKVFISLVDQILIEKKENINADTIELEDKIDEMVYGLYELTSDEIQVIKESLEK